MAAVTGRRHAKPVQPVRGRAMGKEVPVTVRARVRAGKDLAVGLLVVPITRTAGLNVFCYVMAARALHVVELRADFGLGRRDGNRCAERCKIAVDDLEEIRPSVMRASTNAVASAASEIVGKGRGPPICDGCPPGALPPVPAVRTSARSGRYSDVPDHKRRRLVQTTRADCDRDRNRPHRGEDHAHRPPPTSLDAATPEKLASAGSHTAAELLTPGGIRTPFRPGAPSH